MNNDQLSPERIRQLASYVGHESCIRATEHTGRIQDPYLQGYERYSAHQGQPPRPGEKPITFIPDIAVPNCWRCGAKGSSAFCDECVEALATSKAPQT